jgi:hypothetical protein
MLRRPAAAGRSAAPSPMLLQVAAGSVDRMSRFRRRRWLIALSIVLVLLGLLVAGASAMRMFRRPRGPLPPRQTDVSLIAGWMTVPYVARTFGVPPDEIFRGIAIAREGNERKSLNELAAAASRSPGELVAAVQAVVKDFQASHPNAPGKPGRPAGDRGPPAKATP